VESGLQLHSATSAPLSGEVLGVSRTTIYRMLHKPTAAPVSPGEPTTTERHRPVCDMKINEASSLSCSHAPPTPRATRSQR
jgi:hypothetical protein